MNDRPAALFLGGMALGMVILALTWVIGGGVPRSSTSDHTGGTQLTGAEPSQASTQPSSNPEGRKQRCTEAAAALALPLRTAASSVAQWEVHVGAMNKLVVGAITLQQATAFWNRTRVGARQRIEAFDRATADLRRQGVDCPSPDMLPDRASTSLRTCAHRVAADVRVLEAAQTAIDTWRRHVRSMNMLRAGMVSPTTATRMWLAMWHRGQHEIDSYQAAARAAKAVPRCAALPGAGSHPE